MGSLLARGPRSVGGAVAMKAGLAEVSEYEQEP